MKIVSTKVRKVDLRLVSYTRALELCARMNRETEVLDFIDQMKPGDVLYDLGACEGRFSIYAAKRGIRCYAVEPEALNFQALTKNIALNGNEVIAINAAVGARSGLDTLQIAQPWAGGHQRVLASASRSDLDFAFSGSQLVKVVALDEFIPAEKFPMPSHLKVDIDGSETAFIEGAAKTLRKIKGVMIELQTRDDSFKLVTDALRASGLAEFSRAEIEPGLFNIWFRR